MDHAWLCQACVHKEDERYICGSVGMDGICTRCSGLAHEVFLVDCQKPHRAYQDGYRHHEFTTSSDIVSYTQFVWDVNMYYRDLGVHPHATRREIREAYQQAEGWNSERLTYIVKQLLDEEVRALYDSCRPGELFMDRYLIESAERRMEDEVARHFAEGGDRSTLQKIDLSHMLNKPLQVVDRGLEEEQYERPLWSWGFYLWQSGCRDTYRLARWQEHLIRAFKERKEVTRIAIGFCGAHMACPVEVTKVGNLTIVFLNEREQPTADLAREAADRVDHTRDERSSVLTP